MKLFEMPEIDVMKFVAEDVITTSVTITPPPAAEPSADEYCV